MSIALNTRLAPVLYAICRRKIATCWFAGYTTSRRDALISRTMVGPRLGIAPMAGARLGYCAKWLAQG